MVQHKYQGFLTDPEQYRLSESYWQDLFREAITSVGGQAGRWEMPWLGMPLRDGNPIFSAVCRERGLGVRVLQYEPTTDEPEIDWWTDTFGDAAEGNGIQELVISCALSDEAASVAGAFIHTWVRRGEVSVSWDETPGTVLLPSQPHPRRLRLVPI